MPVDERRVLAAKHGASALEVEDAAAWEAARDMGMTAGEYLRELEQDRALFESWDATPRKALEVGHHDTRTAAAVAASAAAVRATLASDLAGYGRDMLAGYGLRTDVVIVANFFDGTRATHRAIKTGTSAAAAKRCEVLTVKLGKATVAMADAESAVKTARAGHMADAAAKTERRANVVAFRLAKLADDLETAKRAHLTAACWDDVPECAPEITTAADAEWFASHAAPKCSMPVKYRDSIRVHVDRAPSDPTGDRASKNADAPRIAAKRAELYGAVNSAAAGAVSTEATKAELSAARAAKRAMTRNANRMARRHAARSAK